MRGLVTDDEGAPVATAQVGILDLEITTTSDEAGRFLLAAVTPGDHTVVAQALGYDVAQKRVEVVAGRATEILVQLRPLAVQAPHFEMFPFAGFEPCQWYSPVGWAHCTWPYTGVHGRAAANGVNLTNYGLPPDLQDNRIMYNYSARPDHTGIVSELFWQAASTAAIYQKYSQNCAWYDPGIDACWPEGEPTWRGSYVEEIGTSPIRYEWTHPSPEELPWIQARATVFGTATERPVGFALDQRVDMYNTVFYGAPPPADFTAGPDE